MSEVNVLQICSYYLGTRLYQKLFDSIEKNSINEDVYVFVDKKFETREIYPSNIYISKCYNKFDRYIFHIKHKKVLNDVIGKLKVDKYSILHAHSLFSNGYIAYKLNKKYKIPYIVAVRNTDVNLFFKKMIHLRNMGFKILKNAEKVIFISRTYKEYTINKFIPIRYKKQIEEKSIVIPNGIDEFWLNNKYLERTMPKGNKIKIIYVGSIDRNKNIETTTKACKHLIAQGYEVSYKVVGNITKDMYRDFIKKHSFIEYIPYCHKEEIINHYRNSDIFVMPSKHETFGLVYAEAMSQGLPIIYTRGQGFDGQFEEGKVGYSVNCKDEYEIAEKIQIILNNYKDISNRCIELVDKFDWNEISQKYIKIYKSECK